MPSESSLRFLETLLETPSPSGFEGQNAAHFRDYVAPFADLVETDALGSVLATVKGSLNGPRIMLAGHIDEIGFLIHYISDEGVCYFKPIGGHDTAVIIGQRVVIQTENGPVKGVIGKKPIHLLLPDEKGKAAELFDMWVDVGAIGGRDEVKELGVQVGDPVTYDVGMAKLAGDRITARALDNRIGAWVVAEALRRVSEMNHEATVIAVATVQEEIGLRGGMTTGLIGVPLRYMHTPCEIISLADADNAAQLLAEVCASVSGEDVWTP